MGLTHFSVFRRIKWTICKVPGIVSTMLSSWTIILHIHCLHALVFLLFNHFLYFEIFSQIYLLFLIRFSTLLIWILPFILTMVFIIFGISFEHVETSYPLEKNELVVSKMFLTLSKPLAQKRFLLQVIFSSLWCKKFFKINLITCFSL